MVREVLSLIQKYIAGCEVKKSFDLKSLIACTPSMHKLLRYVPLWSPKYNVFFHEKESKTLLSAYIRV